MTSSLPPKSDQYPLPAHVASFETFMAGLNTFLGADFNTDLLGELHLNAATIIARDIQFTEHSPLEAEQVARDICTYTAERLALGRATTLTKPFNIVGSEPLQSTAGVTHTDFDPRTSPTWQNIRPYVAHRLAEDLWAFRESHVDSGSETSRRIVANIDDWLPVVRDVAQQTTHEVIVTDSPQLLPGVEVIAIANGTQGSKRFK